ncbi:MAG: ribosome small subunit-dependent GTPase A [Porphyromonas sp.]|nr:ribosome small subunit-dependent GTPase A [Porphyromonas sp.]
MRGLVVQSTGSFYMVRVGADLYKCKLKGNFKLDGIRTTNPIAVGDYVMVDASSSDANGGISWIHEILPRTNYIIRRASNLSKEAHILGANLDRTLLLVTINYPITTTTFIDRYLASAEAYRVPVALVFNKVDRYGASDTQLLHRYIATYQKVGYDCFSVSALTGKGLDEVRHYLSEGVTLIAGHSGVGKSTFINALAPNAAQQTAAISEAHNTGVHTTTFSTMIPYGAGEAYLIDTPGIKGFGTIDFEREEVGHYFPEIFKVSKGCHYSNCSHTHEPKCAVRALLEQGEISPTRYKSYLSILKDDPSVKYRA